MSSALSINLNRLLELGIEEPKIASNSFFRPSLLEKTVFSISATEEKAAHPLYSSGDVRAHFRAPYHPWKVP